MKIGIQKDRDGHGYTNRQRIKETQHASLFSAFIDSMTDYLLAQTNYQDACKIRFDRQNEIRKGVTGGTSANANNIEADQNIMDEEGNLTDHNGIMSEQEFQNKHQMMADIQARHKDIIHLEKHIRELHDMFMEITVLLESQGELVDRVEVHVDCAQEYIEEARGETTAAKVYRNKAQRKKLICMIGIIILIILIMLPQIIYLVV